MRLLFQHHPCPKSMGTEVRGGVPLGRVADVLNIAPPPMFCAHLQPGEEASVDPFGKLPPSSGIQGA